MKDLKIKIKAIVLSERSGYAIEEEIDITLQDLCAFYIVKTLEESNKIERTREESRDTYIPDIRHFQAIHEIICNFIDSSQGDLSQGDDYIEEISNEWDD